MVSHREPLFRTILLLWIGLGTVLALFAGLLAACSHRFDWQLPVQQMPAAALGVGMSAAGVVYLAALPLIRMSLRLPTGKQNRLVAIIMAIGVGLRLMMFFSEPAMEDDYNRYLWEGALVANAISPYAVSPMDARRAGAETRLGRLAEDGMPVLARVNHPNLRSTYPPVAQAAFALAHTIAPWNLIAWRVIAFICDAATMAILLMLLREAGRPAIWSALYWWNPIVIKELVNSAHMDGLATVLLLAALLLSAKRKDFSAVAVLGLAIGAKVWPVLLVPLVVRPLWPRLLPTVGAVALLLTMSFLWLVPILAAGFDGASGYVAYARHWTTNSALFPLIDGLSGAFLQPFGSEEYAWAAGRAIVAACLGVLAIWQSRQPIRLAEDLMQRAGLVVAGLVLLSPAQFPWYMVWMIPFLAFQPYWGLLAITVTVPLYYVSFHFLARGTYEVFADWIVPGIWAPIWILLAAQALNNNKIGALIRTKLEYLRLHRE